MATKKNSLSELKNKHSFRLIFVIIKHGYGEEITGLLKEHNVRYILQCDGEGTARTYFSHILSLEDVRKDVLLALVESDRATAIIKIIDQFYNQPGIAFSIKLNGIGINMLNYLKEIKYGNK